MKTVILRNSWLLLTGLSLLFVWPVNAQQGPWPAVKKETKPWTRWWWIGSAVNEKNLASSLDVLQQAGFGGVEIAPIYGAMGYEPQYVSFLSPRWTELLRYTVASAGERQMGVDLTTGTGWPFGGPQITKAYAASKTIIQQYHLSGGKSLTQPIRVNDEKQKGAALQALTAYSGNQIISLMDKVGKDGRLHWSPASGEWELYALFDGRTLQQVKRAAPGAEGYTLDHLSAKGLQVYLHRFDTAFKYKAPGVRSFYNDSYEVYNADWTPAFLTAFKQKRGYDLSKYLRELASNDSTDLVARVKSDYRETMSELLLENFTRPWTKWAHGYKSLSKNQAHGSPANLLDLYAAVDIPECETYGSTYFPIPGLRRDSADIRNVDPDPVMLKFASSAGHLEGRPLISCETFTWLTEHFKTSLSQCKPEVEQAFLAGVNHVFYHGNTFSPPEVPWPGWLFYASVNFVPTNSFWPHLPGLNEYITRVQSVLQSGFPDNELLVYWPVYDTWHRAKGHDMPLMVHSIDEWLHPTAFYKQVKALQQAGYSLDFASDRQLAKVVAHIGKDSADMKRSTYKVVVIPKTRLMPVTTMQHIMRLAREGAIVMMESLPEDVPGLTSLDKRRKALKTILDSLQFKRYGYGIQFMKYGKGSLMLCDDVKSALIGTGVLGETLTGKGLKFIRRKDKNTTWYYIVNHTPQKIDEYLPLNKAEGAVILLDPQTGRTGVAQHRQDGGRTVVKLQLLPGEAMIVHTDAGVQEQGLPDWKYLETPEAPITLSGSWQLTFTNGGPFIPAARRLDKLMPWTALEDTAANAYCGSGVYTTTFTLPEKKTGEYVLDIGQVHESAHVWVNGQDAGILWAIPFRARIGQYLKAGSNEIRIEVANLMANRIRYMDQHQVQWRRYHEINFVNINYTPFNAAGWPVQVSGLTGPVTITRYE
ncbi:glycosyl hydrolase [Chitinophaga filiformis]|uniref:Glycosyl hydrolases family 2, sugar binding domain n=1 Tax=Chitinophaga filiformis TaxID=104663 RepID=A0A1G7Y096_CHIFI|nr:glycosyl hydrolase [Chitinophaga filiformis]SDG89868.1 Glycosyl hydrolases family 2, sugar binding domain [Chitinophaga filiformis]